MEVVSIERSTYEELLMSFNSFVTKMKEMASMSGDCPLAHLAHSSVWDTISSHSCISFEIPVITIPFHYY